MVDAEANLCGIGALGDGHDTELAALFSDLGSDGWVVAIAGEGLGTW